MINPKVTMVQGDTEGTEVYFVYDADKPKDTVFIDKAALYNFFQDGQDCKWEN